MFYIILPGFLRVEEASCFGEYIVVLTAADVVT